MSHVTGLLVVDAPASALNNSGKDDEARTDNAVAVKFIRAPNGRYPYVSAQAVRFWLRNQLAVGPDWAPEWKASPVFRESKVAYTDAEPTLYDEDDVFGYMRAASKSKDEAKAQKRAEIAKSSTPVDEEVGEVTRVSPLRVGTLVSIAPVRITSDFGTMARADGDPVPHEHQFYRAHLAAPIGIDLTALGTFFSTKRVGFKNVDKHRVESATKAGAKKETVRRLEAYRLPIEVRTRRARAVVRALGRLEGGAKQTLHLTDTAPAVLVLAVCKSGHQPFLRLFGEGDGGGTVLRVDVLEEALAAYADALQGDVYVGWAKGFLDAERAKLEAVIAGGKLGRTLRLGHPREMADAFAAALGAHAEWFE